MRAMLLCLATLAASWADGPEPALQRFEFRQAAMGTSVRIVLYAAGTETAEAAADSAFERVHELDSALSDYNPDGELLRVCAEAAGGAPVPVSEDLWRVLWRAQEISREADGALDVTISPVVRLWRQARTLKRMPDPARIQEALARVGYQFLRLDTGHHSIQFLRPNMRIDLGAIAKGYVADEALCALTDAGVACALVDAGGQISMGDAPPGADGWRVAVASLDPEEKPESYLVLSNATVATSGDAHQALEIDGVRYSHIVDPRTGIGLTGRRSVTVVAPDGMTSDGWATALCVLDPKEGLERLRAERGTASLYVRDLGRGEETYASAGWARLVAEGCVKRATLDGPR